MVVRKMTMKMRTPSSIRNHQRVERKRSRRVSSQTMTNLLICLKEISMKVVEKEDPKRSSMVPRKREILELVRRDLMVATIIKEETISARNASDFYSSLLSEGLIKSNSLLMMIIITFCPAVDCT
jgi:hypothetical protein